MPKTATRRKRATTKKTKPKKIINKKTTKQTTRKKTTAKRTTVERVAKKKAAVKPKAKKERYKRSVPPTEEALQALIDERGMRRGFVTDNEILFAFGEIEDHLRLFEAFLDRLEKRGIHFIEMKEGFLGRAEEAQNVYDKIRLKVDAKVDFTDITQDSIQMYLREIGKIPLL
ncbi:hypothetical protein IH979_00705, partial [Patescibacteria group bacterium]|nr:hypothetical protein [Patescibacteria group bacterium]